jgi:hypothetical protein
LHGKVRTEVVMLNAGLQFNCSGPSMYMSAMFRYREVEVILYTFLNCAGN